MQTRRRWRALVALHQRERKVGVVSAPLAASFMTVS
jgi:hypothetical protein